MTTDDSAPTRLYSIAAVGKVLGVSRNTVLKLLSTGTLGYVRIGRRRLIPAAYIDRWIEENLILRGDRS